MKDLGIGLIGLSDGEAVLELNSHYDTHARVVAVCDSAAPRARAAAQRHTVPFVTTDYIDLIDQAGVDVVAVFDAGPRAFDICMAVVVAGKHLLCADPPTASLEQALELAREADRRGLQVLTGPLARWCPRIQALRALVSNGDLGDVRVADALSVTSGTNAGADAGDTASRLAGPLSLLRWLVGEIAEVSVLGRDSGDQPADGLGQVRFASGAIGRAAAICCGAQERPEVTVSIYGDRGSVSGDRVVLDSVAGRPVMTFLLDDDDAAAPALQAVCALEACIAERAAAQFDHWDAARTAAVVSAARESLRTGLPATVPTVAP